MSHILVSQRGTDRQRERERERETDRERERETDRHLGESGVRRTPWH